MKHEIILETPCLLLRKKVVEDARFFLELNSDLIVSKYTGDEPFKDLPVAENIVNYVISQYQKNGYGRWIVIEKDANNSLNRCGLKYHDDTEETDMGYRFTHKYWVKGYVTEDSLACVDYGFNNLNLNRVKGKAMKENLSSINVLKKIGMTFHKEDLCNGHDAQVYELKKENYK